MTTINTSNYSLDFLPAVPLVETFSYVGPNDLSNISKVNKRFYSLSKENSLWKLIAKKISLPLAVITDENSAQNQVRIHILNLKKVIKNLKESLLEDIAKIIVSKSTPSFEEIQLLKDYRKARDIITVWSVLDSRSAPKINIKWPTKAKIDRANQFTNWVAKNSYKFAFSTSLYLYDQQLSFLPAEIGQLTHLTRLHLGANHLSSLPEEIFQLTQLRKLDLSNNQLSILASEIGQLTQLRKLHLSNNQLSILASEMGQLAQLQHLDLSNNQLSILPSEIGQLTQLQELDLCNNQLSILPSQISQLTQLGKLILSNNQLSTLPSEIGQLTQLEILDLRANQLSILPSHISQLTQLQRLGLSKNQLSMLPSEIGQLTQLQELDLSNNQLSTLPLETTQLRHLKHFYLKGNPLFRREYAIAQDLLRKNQISFMKKTIVGISLAAVAYYYPTEIMSGLENSLPYVGAIAGAVAVQKLIQRYFQ